MKKEYLISLIEKLALNNIQNIESILRNDEKVLYALYNLNGDFFGYGVSIVNAGYKTTDDIIKAINILGDTTINNRLKVVNILTNKSLIDKDMTFTLARMIIDYKDSPSLRYLYQYMIDKENIIKDRDTMLKELKLLSECKGELNAKYVYKVLLNKNEKIRSIMVELINILKNIEHVPSLEAVYEMIRYGTELENGVLLDGVRFISTLKNSRYICSIATSAYIEHDLIKSGFNKEAAMIVSEFNDDDLAELAFNTMITKCVIDGKVVLESGNFIKKIEDYKYSEYIYTVLTNQKLIEEGISLEVAYQILNSPNVFNAGYIEKYITSYNVNPLYVIEGCELINSAKNSTVARYTLDALTNKYLNDNGTAIECAYVMLKCNSNLKNSFIYNFVLSKKEFACNKDVSKIIEDICKSNLLFNGFRIKLEGKQAKLLEFGTIIINYNSNIRMSSLIVLFDAMEKLRVEEIELIKNKYRGLSINNFIFRHNFNNTLKNVTSNEDIIKLVKDITGTTVYDKKDEYEEANVSIEKKQNEITSNSKTNSDAEMLLDILSKETDSEVKTDALVKKLVKVRENNTINK